MKKPAKNRHHRKASHLTPRLPEITPRASSATSVVSLAASFSDNETVFKARIERTRRKSVWRVIDCGVGVAPLPVDLFKRILMLLPAKDVVLHCSLVCRSWLAACRDPKFWKQRCEEDNKFVPDIDGQPPKSIMMLYFKEPYTRNLLHNTHAMGGLNHWVQPRGCQVVNVEEFPDGACAIRDYIPAEEIQGRIQNWVTSYRYTFLSQAVVLLEEGCSRTVLDELRPPIAVSAWCAAHEESGAKFYMLVRLIDKRKREAGRFEKEVDLSYEVLRKIWHKVEYTFTDYKPGVRKVVFKIGGMATQGWRGSFGAKFTLPCVRFAFGNPLTDRQSPDDTEHI